MMSKNRVLLPALACLIGFGFFNAAQAEGGVGHGGGADYQAEISCYLESKEARWLSFDIKNALQEGEGAFPENALAQEGLGQDFLNTISSRKIYLSLIPGPDSVRYIGGNDIELLVNRRQVEDPTRIANVPLEVAGLYSFFHAEARVGGNVYKGYCVRDVEFFLAMEFAPLK